MAGLFRSKPNKYSESYFPLYADIHSHILPGIDDGSPDIETSVALVQGLMKLGITHSTATPHIIGDMYRNNSSTINSARDSLRTALAERNIDFKVNAAAEYMMDDYFLELLRDKTALLTLKDDLVLTEFSYADKPGNIEEMVFKIITEGYRPVLAHPERYAYFHDDLQQYDYLRDLGFLLQVNLLSLAGYYGKPAARAASYIMKNDLASFAGTDLHHDRHMQALHHPVNRGIFEDVFAGKRMNEEMAF